MVTDFENLELRLNKLLFESADENLESLERPERERDARMSNERGAFDSLLSFLRNEGRLETLPGLADWFKLYAELKRHALLGPYRAVLNNVAPAPVCRELERWTVAHTAATDSRARMLCEFASRASCEGLHAILIKGMGVSEVAFGEPYARQSGDMDILVESDDIPKADYVLRALGWYQPGEARLVRPKHDSGQLDDAFLKKQNSPYPLRSNAFLPHVTNYYRQGDAGYETIELHDRFHGIDSEKAKLLLWDSSLVKCEAAGMLTLGTSAAFVVSALSLHEDSETVRANTGTRGTMGLKTCVDLHQLNTRMTADDIDLARCLIGALGVAPLVSAALGNCIDIFPDDAEQFSQIVPTEILGSAWTMSYSERLSNPKRKAECGVRDLAERIEALLPEIASDCLLSRDGEPVSWRPLPAASGEGRTPFSWRMAEGGSARCVELLIPECFVGRAEDLVFQVVMLSFVGGGNLGERTNIYYEGETWNASATPLRPNFIDGHANKAAKGEVRGVRAVGSQSGAMVIKLEVPASCDCAKYVLPSVWHRIRGVLTRRVAGVDFCDLAERAIMTKRA